jgi:DNA-binding NarL/FixJ family response regulator
MIRVFVVDDHPVVREGVVAILAAEDEISVVGQASSGEDALAALRTIETDVVVVDVRLPRMTGTELCASLRASSPRIRTVVFTSFPNEGAMVNALAAGAAAFLVKQANPDILRDAVRTVARGGTFVDPLLAPKLVSLATKGRKAKGPFGLTLTEMRVLELLPRGLSNRHIATELGVTEHTIKTHVQHVMRKLQVHDRAHAVAVAVREGLA